MKKSGFTLAEVLITLGIIGVVAALTAPALIQNAGNAKIGPTLQKVKSTIENANERMLTDNEVSSLYAITSNNALSYAANLVSYISGSSYNTTELDPSTASSAISPGYGVYKTATYSGSTGTITGTTTSVYTPNSVYLFQFSDSIDLSFWANTNAYTANGSFTSPYMGMIVDINGALTSPNRYGKDLFWFIIDKSGRVIPYGGKTHAWLTGISTARWNSSSGYCNSTGVYSSSYGGETCAGSIFDNNLKVIYQ